MDKVNNKYKSLYNIVKDQLKWISFRKSFYNTWIFYNNLI